MFRTEIEITPSKEQIHYGNQILTLGSCFANRMGDRFVENKFNTCVNPFGTIFNPFSLNRLVLWAIEGTYSENSSYLNHQGISFNYHFHSSFFASSQSQLEGKITQKLESVHQILKTAQWLTLTWGTAIVYKRNQEVVANCHKVPAREFDKRLLTVEEIVDSFNSTYEKLISINPKLQLILTLSPVRHIKDTLPLNSLSKSLLRVAIEEITQQHLRVHYFPAFEIMMDDLRDYRFYEKDYIHPNEQAEDYLWNRFTEQFIDPESQKLMGEWQKLKKADRAQSLFTLIRPNTNTSFNRHSKNYN